MKHIVQDLSSDIDWLELEYSVKSTERAFLSESMENPTHWQVWGQEVTRPLFYGNMWESPFVELKQVISYIQVVHL